MSSKIEIPISKVKVIGLLIGTIFFVVMGSLFICSPQTFISPIMRSPEIILLSGIASVIFFGLCLIFIVRKVFDTKPGLVIDQYGITDNTGAASLGLIEWADITGIEKRQIMSNKFLILYTNNPEKYTNRIKSVIAKKTATMNNRAYGSPISIVSNSLKMNFDDLEQLLRTEFEKRRERRDLHG